MSSRRLTRSAAQLMVSVWLTGLALPVFGAGHGMGLDDPACNQPLWSNSQSGAHLDKDVRGTDEGHCGICHLQRAVRGALHSVARTVEYARQISVNRPAGQSDLPATHRDLSSPRAPPSALVS